jgi:TatD DNase family protein
MMFIDSHTHLDHCREDPAALVADAREAGVGLVLQSGTDLSRSRRSVELAEQFPEVFATVGYHPHEAATLDEPGFAEIEKLTAHQRVVAVGETGFDYHDHCPHDTQAETFVRHLDLARRAGLPVVVHTREAAEDTLATLAAHGQGLTVILHCFSLPDRLEEIVARGYYLSFAGNVTYPVALDLQAAARAVPADLLLLEPVPLRGRPNRPGLVAQIYEFVAGLRGTSVEGLAAQVAANAGAAFPRLATALGGRS